MEQRIYFDNASTSFPKAPGVGLAARFFLEEVGCNIARGSYAYAQTAATIALETRERLSRLIGAPGPKNVIFTANITTSMNILLKGFLRPQDHILVSSVEHNGVMRPLRQLEKMDVSFTRIPGRDDGYPDISSIESLIRPQTRAICVTHASNVCGTVLPIAEIGAIAKRFHLRFLVDSAQTAGVFPLDMKSMGIDALAFTGHKGLLGPQGIGGFAVTGSFAEEIEPLISGGTGSLSDSEEVPRFLPDRFEAGTLNLPGIYGLHAALGYLEQVGIDAIRQKELSLAKQLEGGLASLSGTKMIGTRDWTGRTAIVSVDFPGCDNAEIAYRLDEEYHILTRCGLHCAPNAHKTLGTFPQGTVRFSLSHANTKEEVDICIKAVEQILGS